MLAPMAPDAIDNLPLWKVGGLLKTDIVPAPIEDLEEAERLLASRMERVKEAQARQD